MQRKMVGYAVTASLILALGVPAAHGSAAHTRLAHEADRAFRSHGHTGQATHS